MRISSRVLGVVVLVAAATAVIPAAPASADPCGASSYKVSGTQYVAYRNCSSNDIRRKGRIGSTYGSCHIVDGGTGEVLLSMFVGDLAKSWGTYAC